MAIKNAAVLSINDGEGVPFEDTSSSSGDVFTKDSPCVEGSVLSTRFLKFKCDFSGVLTVPPPPYCIYSFISFHLHQSCPTTLTKRCTISILRPTFTTKHKSIKSLQKYFETYIFIIISRIFDFVKQKIQKKINFSNFFQ